MARHGTNSAIQARRALPGMAVLAGSEAAAAEAA